MTEGLQLLETYDSIYTRACQRKGGADKLESMLSKPKSKQALLSLSSDRVLSAFTKKIFQSGFVWRVVEQKWPNFEEHFFQFDIEKVLLMSNEMLEKKATDPKIIRNLKKVMTIRDNALMLKEFEDEYGNIRHFFESHSAGNIVDLWALLKKSGNRLGGNTGPYSLRALGIDTFLMTNDVTGYFVARKIISGAPTGKRNLQLIQTCFNQLCEQSGRSLQEVSNIIAFSVGDNYRFEDETWT
jgi:3-methyladenine DNA glycosylase Tag